MCYYWKNNTLFLVEDPDICTCIQAEHQALIQAITDARNFPIELSPCRRSVAQCAAVAFSKLSPCNFSLPDPPPMLSVSNLKEGKRGQK